jgi:hypothetical protein
MSNPPSRASSVDPEAVEEQRLLQERRTDLAARVAQARQERENIEAEERRVAAAIVVRREEKKKERERKRLEEEEKARREKEEKDKAEAKRKEKAKSKDRAMPNNGAKWAVQVLDKGFDHMSPTELAEVRRRLLDECVWQRKLLQVGEITELADWVHDIESMKDDDRKRKSVDEPGAVPSDPRKRVRKGPSTSLPPAEDETPHPTCERCRSEGIVCRAGTGRSCATCQRRKMKCNYPPGTNLPNRKLQRARARGQKSNDTGECRLLRNQRKKNKKICSHQY